MKYKYFNGKAFTLSELLIIVIIVLVLVTIATPFYKKNLLKARAVEAVNLLNSVRTKQAQSYARDRAYFTSFRNMNGSLTIKTETIDSQDSSILYIGDYKIELDSINDCAIVYYQPDPSKAAVFSFSVSYLRPGLGCNGNVCGNFGDVVGSVQDVCGS